MAGHNKWSKVKRLKGALDVKRGKIFSKLAKEITLAAKTGGGSPDGNPRLRSAVSATDNKNCTAQDLRSIFTRHGGNLATSGAVNVAGQFLRLADTLEDNDDVQQIHANADIPEEVLARISD